MTNWPPDTDHGVFLEVSVILVAPPVASGTAEAAAAVACAVLVLLTGLSGVTTTGHGLIGAAAWASASCLLASSALDILPPLPVSQTLTVPSLTRVKVKRGMMVREELNVPLLGPVSVIVIVPVEACI